MAKHLDDVKDTIKHFESSEVRAELYQNRKAWFHHQNVEVATRDSQTIIQDSGEKRRTPQNGKGPNRKEI
jgi:hypothetical protein